MDIQQLQRIGDYQVVRLIAEGGMSWVFEVIDPRFDVHRALKLLKPEAALGREFERFASEAKVLAQLDHSNIITIYDFGRDEASGLFFYTMSLIQGASLSDLEVTSTERVCEIILDALAGLSEIHDAGVIHRDIKPGNILVSHQGRAYIADLGIARSDASDPSVTRVAEELTRTGMMVGTLLYSSPEQTRGQVVKKSSDVFSMGLTLYKVITGESVYDKVEELESTSGQEVMMYLGSLVHSGTELALVFPKSVPPAIRRVIVKACHMRPEQRYQDAREMYDALCDALDRDYPESTGGFPVLPAALGALAVVIALGAGAAWWMNRGVENSPPAPEPVAVTRPAEPSAPAQAASSTLAEDDLADRTRILLVRAEEQLAINRLTRPAGDNALESYRAVLRLDPTSTAAAAGLETIRSRQIALAQSAEDRGDDAKAVEFYRRALLATPGDPELERRLGAAAERIEQGEEAERQLARLEAERLQNEARIAQEQQASRSAAEEQEQQVREREARREADGIEAARAAAHREKTKRDAEAERQAKLFATEDSKARAAAIGMVMVPAGSFQSGKGGATAAETEAFLIDETEVTVQAYGECVADGACPAIRLHRNCNFGQAGREDHPINCASLEHAQSFCAWAEKRVPTGAEWEKAARGSEGRSYPWGEEAPTCSLQVMRARGCERTASSASVGSRPDGISPFGALDMLGNVWEWTENPGDRHPTLRGGAWNTGPVSVDHLYPYGASKGTPSTGFRCIR